MSKYKNIIFIHGDDSYGVEKELQRWIAVFEKKYGTINIDRYDLNELPTHMRDTLLSGGLFAQKRLFIFRGWRDKKSKKSGIEALLENIKDTIPDDHFLLFHNVSPKETALLAWLWKHTDTRVINTLWNTHAWQERFAINPSYIKSTIHLYKQQESLRDKGDVNVFLWHNIANTLAMLEALSMHQDITDADIHQLVQWYGGDTLFSLTDAITAMNIKKALVILNRIKSIHKTDMWIPSLIWLIRNTVYIKSFQSLWLTEKDIANHIKLHPYVLSKWYRAPISYEKIKDFYQKIIQTNISYKRGKWMKDSELWKILSIELALLNLKK